jgi:osmotically-inducible protein OsmY
VESGEVTLTGSVDSRDAKWLTEDLVNSVAGVREVNNRLKVAR